MSVLRIQHSQGMQRLKVDSPEEKWQSVQQKIFKLFGIPPDSQILSSTPLSKPNFIDTADNQRAFKSFHLKNGQILYLVSSLDDLPSKKIVGAKTYILSAKCDHKRNGQCLNCIPIDPGEGSKPATAIKGKCLHGTNASCTNCSDFEAKAPKPRCAHKEDTFCNNCVPERSRTKKEEKELLKKQNCFCKEGQKCLFCVESTASDLKDVLSYSQFLAKSSQTCHHDKTSLRGDTGYCNICGPREIVSYRMRDCRNHAPWPNGACSQCTPPNAVLGLQSYRYCDEISVINFAALQKFVSSWLSAIETQKAAFLIGSYENVKICEKSFLVRANVHAVYVPPAFSSDSGVELLPDPNFEMVKRITKSCGLEIVGVAMTTLPRRDDKYGGDVLMSGREIKQAAKLQAQFADPLGHSKFVTMIISHNAQNEVEPSCYQVSDQCVALEKEGLLSLTDDYGFLALSPTKGSRYSPLVMYKNKALKPGEKFIPDEFLVKVTPMQPTAPQSFFRFNDFPLERGSTEDLKRHLQRTMEHPYHIKFSDFPLLLWLSRILEPQEQAALAECVAKRTPVGRSLGEYLDLRLAEYFC